MSPDELDRWMTLALSIAGNGAGHVSPNPLVGAVLVGPEGTVLGQGWHGQWGGPHAEVWAVRDAERGPQNDRLDEATLFVTLEPCNHHGKTPPCVDLIIEKRIPRVVVGTVDPFPEVAGKGIVRLREAGVEVVVGVNEHDARRLTEAFRTHVLTGRPLVTLKLAVSLDGRVATRTGSSRWVTSEASRTRVHAWRAEADAVLIGAGPARADDPALTARDVTDPQKVRQPLRVVLDRTGTLPPTLKLFTDADAGRTVAVVAEGVRPAYAPYLADAGGCVLEVPLHEGRLDLGALLDRLGRGEGLPEGARRVQSVLVEAGPGLATALLERDLVDRLFAFVAPKLVGGDGTPALGPLGVADMAEARGFVDAVWEPVGADVLLRGYLREA